MPAADGLRPITIAIASYQRRRPLVRLLSGLGAQLANDGLTAGVDVVVVLDGSTDRSQQAVERLSMPVPLRVVWQPNQGLAAARNAGLDAATGTLVWFLDDDLVPAPGLVARHRRVHEPGDDAVIVGPAHPAPDHRVHPLVRRFWIDRHAELAETRCIERFDQFSAANTSGPVSMFEEVGGFDPDFVGYGVEDYDLAVRLLAAGTVPRYDPDAVAWHRPPHGAVAIAARQRDDPANQIRLATKYPETFDALFPSTEPDQEIRAIRRLGLHRRPRLLAALATAMLPAVAVEAWVSRQRQWRLLGIASRAAYVASVVRHDPDGRFTARVLGDVST